MPLVAGLRQRKLVQWLLACAAVPWLLAARDHHPGRFHRHRDLPATTPATKP